MSLPDNQRDIEAIFARRFDQGADHWTTPDHRLAKGGPYSALESPLLLVELGLEASHPLLTETADLILDAQRPDGRFRLAPGGAIYPCHTINALNTLMKLERGADERVALSCSHLLESQYEDGGWRCHKFSFGRGPETDCSNPGPTLTALDAFRHTTYLNNEPKLDRAVEFLLAHWVSRRPIGPCHYGIGTLFLQVEYPFRTYNLFRYLYVLSFYRSARQDVRFLDALNALEERLCNGMIVPQRVHPALAQLEFCKKGEPSALGTARYLGLRQNLDS